MSIQRYELEIYHCNGGEMLVSETGDYVSHDDYAALEAKCAALAAEKEKFAVECAAAKIAIAYLKSGRQDFSLNTPATDAFLAEVLAQGVEMFASKCKEESKRAHSSDYRDSWWVSGENAEDFAAQLRQEAAK